MLRYAAWGYSSKRIASEEGVSIGCDEMVIPKNAPNPKLAHAMIDLLLDADVAAENMEEIGYLCPNTAALKNVSKEFLQNPALTIPADVKAKCEALEDHGSDLPKWTKVWDEVKYCSVRCRNQRK